MKQDDAKKEAQRILHAPEAQQLLALLSRGGGPGGCGCRFWRG